MCTCPHTLKRIDHILSQSIEEFHHFVLTCAFHMFMFSNNSSFGSVRPKSVRRIHLEIVTGHNVPLFNLYLYPSLIIRNVYYPGLLLLKCGLHGWTLSSDAHGAHTWQWMAQCGGWGGKQRCVQSVLRDPLDGKSPDVAKHWAVLTITLMRTFGF